MNDDPLTELFARAAELDPAARAELLEELARDAPERARELAALLAASEGGEWEVDRTPWREFGHAPGSAGVSELPERIGPYRIVRELGRGGMGRVFLAEEETADFRRAVALKVIDRPGPDADAVRRFRDEVRILASLEHPGIARFLAGGRSTEGVWFLALELVEGEDLVRHCDRRELGVRERVELFLPVVDSVRFAHERGVVHRDLKPGHLLVGEDGRPRLLDFGISKLLATDPEAAADPDCSARTTRTESRALTPAYASPEQFRGERVTPASDVYSLGVVLYELLCGRRPFDAEGGSQLELERAVLEKDPVPPSTAARRTAPVDRPGVERTDASTRRNRPIDRDLDAICMKALRKSPNERYGSAAELGEDLRRYLDGLPVLARRGGWRYRSGRFVRRERQRLLVAAALVLALAGFAHAVASAREASRLRPPAAPTPRPYPLAKVSSRPVEHWEKEFAASPDSVEAGAAFALALIQKERLDEASLALARIRQIPGRADDPLADYLEGMLAHRRDQPQRALVMFTRAREGALARGRGEILGKIRSSRGRVLVILGEREEGEREMELALADFERAGDSTSAAQVLNNLAIESLQRGDYVRGEERLEAALAKFRLSGIPGAIVFRNLAEVAIRRGRPDVAERWARESLRVDESLGRANAARRIWVLAEALAEQGRPQEAVPLLDEAIGYLRAAGDEPDLVHALELRTLLEIAAARFDRVNEVLAELESMSRRSGARACLIAQRRLRGYEAATKGEFGVARGELTEVRRLLLEENEPILAALVDVDRALLELGAGDREAARKILDDPSLEVGIGSSAGVLARAVAVRIAAETGKFEMARAELLALGDDDADSPSLRRKIVFLRSRAALAIAEGRTEDARRDLVSAAEAASAGGRVAEELALRFTLIGLDGEPGVAARDRLATRARALHLPGPTGLVR